MWADSQRRLPSVSKRNKPAAEARSDLAAQIVPPMDIRTKRADPPAPSLSRGRPARSIGTGSVAGQFLRRRITASPPFDKLRT